MQRRPRWSRFISALASSMLESTPSYRVNTLKLQNVCLSCRLSHSMQRPSPQSPSQDSLPIKFKIRRPAADLMADLGQISGYGAHVEEKKFTEKKFTKTLEPDPLAMLMKIMDQKNQTRNSDSSTVSKRSHLSAFDTLPAPELNPSPRKKTHRSLEVSGHHRSDAFTKLLERHDLSPEAAEYSWYLTQYGPFSVEKVLGFIEAMKTVDGVQPDRETYVAAAKAIAKKGKNGDHALAILKSMEQDGFSLDWDAHHAAIIGWVHGGRRYRAMRYLKSLLNKSRTARLDGSGSDLGRMPVNILNSVLSGMAKAEDPASMCELLDLMEEFDVDPDAATFNICLQFGSGRIEMHDVTSYIGKIRELGLLRVDTMNSVMTSLFKESRTAEALAIFDKMLYSNEYPDPNIISFTMAINHCGQNGMSAHVSRYVDLMNAASGNKGPHREKRNVYDSPKDVQPDAPFYKVMLANSARFGDTRMALEYFKDLMLHSKRYRPFEFHKLMEMYSTLGELRPMHRLYKRMKAHGVSPNLETFRILAFSHLKHSSPDRAFAVLDSSKEGEVSPSELRSLYQAFFGKLVEMGNVEFGWMTLESMMKTCQSIPDIKEVRKFEMLLVKRQDFERLWKLSAILDRSGISPPLLRFSLLKMITFARKKEDRLNPRSDLIRTVVAALEMGNSVKSKPSRFVYNHWLLVHVGDKEGFVRILKEMMRLNLGFDEQTFFLILAHALKWRNFSVVWAVWTRFLAEYDLSKNLSLHADSVYGKRDDSTVSSSSFKFGPTSSKTLLFAARKVIFASFKNKQTKAALHVVLSLRTRGLNPCHGLRGRLLYRMARVLLWLEKTSKISRRAPQNVVPHFKAKRVGAVWREILQLSMGDEGDELDIRRKKRKAQRRVGRIRKALGLGSSMKSGRVSRSQ